MKKSLVFARRNGKEILRDPLSFVFCLGLPIVLLLVFRFINNAAGGNWLSMAELVPGVSVFSFSFIMLYMTLLVSKDRTTSFLARLRNAPLSAADFVFGYALPGLVLGVAQAVITYVAGLLITVIPHGTLTNGGFLLSEDAMLFPEGLPPVAVTEEVFYPLGGVFAAVAAGLPAIVFFLALGIFFGSVLSEKSAPGISSGIITGAGLLSGAWMPLATMGGFETFCRVLPFYPAVIVSRNAFLLSVPDTGTFFLSLVTASLWALAALALSVFAFFKTMKQ